MMTKQEVFDKVVTHLRSMKERSIRLPYMECAYRGSGGAKCAAGCLIDDEFYSERLEGWAVVEPVVLEALRSSGVPTDDSTIRMVERLQLSHDCASNWSSGSISEDSLRMIAEDCGVKL